MAEEDGFDMRDSLNYAVMITDSIVYDQNNLLSFQVTNYSYEGGAHGGMSLLCYLLTTDGKRLYESDLFIDDYYDVLKEILVQKILKQNKVETLDALSELGYINTDGIVPNGNFYLSEGGITYVYGQYEIACYAMGISEVYLPFAEIKHLLKENTPLTPLL